MKGVLLFLMTMVVDMAHGAGDQETVWYAADGKVVKVEAPGAPGAESPFVAEWRKREIERRERVSPRWTGEIQPLRYSHRSHRFRRYHRPWVSRSFYALPYRFCR